MRKSPYCLASRMRPLINLSSEGPHTRAGEHLSDAQKETVSPPSLLECDQKCGDKLGITAF